MNAMWKNYKEMYDEGIREESETSTYSQIFQE